MSGTTEVREVPLLRAGRWERSETERWGDVFNPSTGAAIARVPLSTAAEVDRVVQAAHAAFPAWAETPPVERARVMFRYRDLMDRHAGELAALVTREHGKTAAEAKGSVQRGLEVIEFACGLPS